MGSSSKYSIDHNSHSVQIHDLRAPKAQHPQSITLTTRLREQSQKKNQEVGISEICLGFRTLCHCTKLGGRGAGTTSSELEASASRARATILGQGADAKGELLSHAERMRMNPGDLH